MGCKPGHTNNPNGRPRKGNSLTELMEEFLEKIPEGEKKTNKEKFIEKVYAQAIEKGDTTCQKMIWNYIDGMPKQSIEHSGQIDTSEKDLSHLTEEELLKIKEGQKIIDSKGIDINGDNTDVA